ncbi:hypothetical protein HRbin26_02426 [bacterium HR26]|nr:hypothetical protein HRbin26_02426 [bacterium HR26]
MRLQPVSSVSLQRTAPRLASIAGILVSVVLALAILRLPAPLNVLVVPGALLGTLLLVVPALAPILLIASVPVQDVGAVPLGVQTLTATKTAVGATAIILPLVLLARRQSLRLPALAVAIVLYILTQVISLHAARELLPGFAEIYRWTVMLLALLTVIHFVRGRAAIAWLSVIVAAGAIGEAALGTVQAVLGRAPESFAVGGGLFRAYGTFGKPNPYAGYLEMTGLWLLPLAVWALHETWIAGAAWRVARREGFAASRELRRDFLVKLSFFAWLSLACASSFLGIGLSFSRGAWLGAAAALVVLLLTASRRVQIAGLGLALVGSLFLLAGGETLLPDAVRERAIQLTAQIRLFDVRDVQLTDETFAAIERMTHWQAGLAMVRDSPWIGIGVGNFNIRFPEFSPHPAFRISQGHAHNYYIHAAAETGLLGLAAYLLVLLLALAAALRATRQGRSALDRALGLGALAATTAVMVHNVVENLHVLNLSVQLAAVWGLAVVAEVGRPGAGTDSRAARGEGQRGHPS